MSGDGELIQIVDATLAEAVRKSGPWLACRAGCWECCVGPFPISQLDAERLRRGLVELQASDAARAQRVRERSRAAVGRLPGLAAPLDEAEFEGWMAQLPDEEACPALDPQTGTCDLYAARPLTCRVFGPPVRWGGDAVGVCELCFVGASDEEIAGCEVRLDTGGREEELEAECAAHGPTLVALALVTPAST